MLESHQGVIPNRDDLILSLRTRVPGIDRKMLYREAENAWRSGDRDSAIECLASGLADTVIVGLWAEYVTAAGSVAHALDVMRPALERDRRLMDTYVELAFELPEMASTEYYLRSIDTHSSRLELALARVNWLMAGQPSIGAWPVSYTHLDVYKRQAELTGDAVGEIMANSPEPPPYGPPFTRAESRLWRWQRPMTGDDIVAMVASRSATITASDADRAAVLASVDDLLATHPDLAGRDVIEVPYVTVAWRVTR